MTKTLLTAVLILAIAAASAADKHTVTNTVTNTVIDVLNSGNSIPLDQYGKNLQQLANRITRSGSRHILMTTPRPTATG